MKQIELTIEGRKAVYHSGTRVVTFFTKNGVLIECEMPKNWALTRVFQFMESIFEADKKLI